MFASFVALSSVAVGAPVVADGSPTTVTGSGLWDLEHMDLDAARSRGRRAVPNRECIATGLFEYWAGCQPIKGRGFGHCVLKDGQCQDGSHGALCGRSEDCQAVPGRGEHGVCIEGKCHDGREGARCGTKFGGIGAYMPKPKTIDIGLETDKRGVKPVIKNNPLDDAYVSIGLVNNGQTGDCQAGLVCHGDSGFLGMGVSSHTCQQPERYQCLAGVMGKCGFQCISLCHDRRDDFARHRPPECDACNSFKVPAWREGA